MRGAHRERATPAEAVPGIRARHRAAVEEHEGVMPTPRLDTVRGTMAKPQPPRRRAQENLVPSFAAAPRPARTATPSAVTTPG